MRKNNKRSAILDAAFEVVEEKGARHLTIDAVAAQSGMSKGGVLYHFGSKSDLLSGMLEVLIDLNQARFEEQQAASSDENEISAILEAVAGMTSRERRASLALLAVAAEDSELLDPAREYMQRTFNSVLGSSKDQMAGTMLLLASEGLRFLDVLDINPFSKQRNKEILGYLQQQARGL